MVGRLNLQDIPGDPLDMKRKAERVLDSPDSGLPPSPSPSAWLPSPVNGEKELLEPETSGRAVVPLIPRLYPLSFGEGVELDPLPAKEIRYTSSVHYDSDRHFIHDVFFLPVGLAMASCSQTVLVLPSCTWRRYKTQVELQPRQQAQRYQSTTIVYPKHARAVYTTTLQYDCRRLSRRFLSSVELEAVDQMSRGHTGGIRLF
ncbi:UNVERIFIED_CONTAM: hypothetical protein FKN15_039804 [Acipenser sinensis]